MAIPLTTNPGGLFRQLGRVGKLALLVDQHQTALPAAFESLLVQYDGQTPPGFRDVIATAVALAPQAVANQAAWLPALQQAAVGTLIRHVQKDKPAAAGSVQLALEELVRQMRASGDTVKRSAVAVAATPAAGNAGDGVAVATATRGDGLPAELLIAEVARLEVTADSFGGGATAGSETATYYGAAGNPADVWAYDWPAGSGVATALTAVSPSSGSYLTGGDFEVFSPADTPDDWAIEVGAAGVEVFEEGTTVYSGLKAVRVAGSATLTRLAQTLAADTLPPALTPLGCVLWVRVSGVPAAGVLTIDLTDAAGAVTTDDQGAANSFTQSLPALAAATWTPVSGVFRTGRSLPVGLKLRVRLSTALSAGTNLYLDRVTLFPLVTVYAGGPAVGVASGAAPFAAADAWTLTSTNDRGGAADNATFQALFERIFGLSSLGLLLPSANTPTVADTLITA